MLTPKQKRMAVNGAARRNKDAKSAEPDAEGNKPEPTAAHAGVGAPAESDVEQVESHMQSRGESPQERREVENESARMVDLDH